MSGVLNEITTAVIDLGIIVGVPLLIAVFLYRNRRRP